MIDLTLQVTVVYSPAPREVQEISLAMPLGSTLAGALQASGLLQRFAAIDHPATLLGIWGRQATLDQPLRQNDRIEIYRPLTVDPKVARRERFAKQGTRAAGLFKTKRAGAAAGY